MGEHRIDTLEERVERLRERTERLQSEFDGVRRRTRRLQGRATSADGSQEASTDGRTDADRLPGAIAGLADDRRVSSDGSSGASDDEVEAAVRRVETDTDEASEDRDCEEIIVA